MPHALVLLMTLAGSARAEGEDPSLKAFEERYRPWVELESVTKVAWDRKGWPQAKYQLLTVRVPKPTSGSITVGYSFTRVRPRGGGREKVQRRFSVSVGARGAARQVGASFPMLLSAGDAFQLPVPLDDPWGTLTDFQWIPSTWEKLSEIRDQMTPCVDPNGAALANSVSPYLGDPELHCSAVLLANLTRRTEVATLFTAKVPGRVSPPFRIVVVPSGERIVQEILEASETTTYLGQRSSSSGPIVNEEAWKVMRVGDRILLDAPVR